MKQGQDASSLREVERAVQRPTIEQNKYLHLIF